MSKRKVDIIEPTARFVNAILGLVRRNLIIRVDGKEIPGKRLGPSMRSRQETYRPLLPTEAPHISKELFRGRAKARQDEPARMTILANRFSGLK